MRGADVVIVGAGVVGAAAAWRLAALGAEVVLVDRGAVASGASGVNAGMVDATGWGRAEGPVDLETTLKMGSWELYRRVQLEEGEPIGFRRSGSLAVVASEGEWELARATTDAAAAAGHDVELVPAADPAAATAALARLATRAGARLLEGHPVTAVRATGEGFAVRAGGGGAATGAGGDEMHCTSLVLAAGAWLAPLARLVGLDVGVVAVRGQMWATPPLPPRVFATFSGMEAPLAWAGAPTPPGAPPQLTHDGPARRTRHLYGRQTRAGEVVVGGDRQEAPADEPAVPEPAGIAANRSHAAEVLPFLADVPVARTWAGLMPFSLDGRPLLGRVPGAGRLFVAGGLASSGVNRGPMAGWLVADLVAGEPVPGCLAEADPAGRVRALPA